MRRNFAWLTGKMGHQPNGRIPTPFFQRVTGKAVKDFLYNHHWAIIVALWIVIIVIQTVEHLTGMNESNLFYIGEVTLMTVLLIITGMLINLLKELHTEQTLAIQAEIARDLHDTIGQNISYLRMKLELLSETDLRTNPRAADEIRCMSEVANDSYDLMRGTLTALRSGSSDDIVHLLASYAGQVEDRSGIQIDVLNQGTPKPLSANQIRQLFFIFRESLSNIEKHAGASYASAQMIWEDDCLNMIIADNGHGFDPDRVPRNHYGLEFMRERIKRINGVISIQSQASRGTHIAIHIPQDMTQHRSNVFALRTATFLREKNQEHKTTAPVN